MTPGTFPAWIRALRILSPDRDADPVALTARDVARLARARAFYAPGPWFLTYAPPGPRHAPGTVGVHREGSIPAPFLPAAGVTPGIDPDGRIPDGLILTPGRLEAAIQSRIAILPVWAGLDAVLAAD